MENQEKRCENNYINLYVYLPNLGYRDSQGVFYTLNPACRHMGCSVSWNDADKTWDCHCHGSRYNARGEVILSPAVYGLLEKKVMEQKNTYSEAADMTRQEQGDNE
ncbi:hypothetical protein ASJ81_03805 [Methanosarcina spelaei]|uniref:Rieske domain-containing protein n=1 Tax=Methanosarcina spelaei TaxID=1036679 RepID=A0A2A2HVI5_9EURY|nr:Rieske 2Fe-2S domain-containing protein [Methanosarcina spelaei]PAV13412.1 hypothetical protein ASJ81_03805 [Methanosarcina spelaei]